MKPLRTSILAILLVPAALLGVAAIAQQQRQQPTAQHPQQDQPKRLVPVLLPDKPDLDPMAVEILKTTSARLAAAHAMSFTAIATYESPARTLQPLAYTCSGQTSCR
jgi:hypothetical protein